MIFDQRDVECLRSVGIDDLGVLVSAAADYVRRYPMLEPPSDVDPLTLDERAVLRSVGARGLDSDSADIAALERSNVGRLAAEYAELISSAYSAREVSERLGVSSSRVRQLVGLRRLYAIDCSGGRKFPRFQFGPEGLLPASERILGAIRPDAHPIAIRRFFMQPTEDLRSDVLDEPLCPRDWLLLGNSPDVLLPLAAAI